MAITRRQVTLVIVLLAALLLAVLGVLSWSRTRVSTNPAALLKRLPTQDSVVVGLDVQALRRDGDLAWLQHSKDAPEPEYTSFVHDTGFDFARDLTHALVSFSPDGTFFLLEGSFDWPKLEDYALHQKGSCYQHLCRLQGSRPERHISFFPLRNDLMAMAVASDDTAATRLAKPGPQADIDVPPQPVWLTLTSGALRNSPSLPGSSRLFASAITDASRITLTLGPSGSDLDLHLDAICRDAQQAGALTQQLKSLTNLLLQAAQHSPNPAASANDLGTLLASGTFDQAGSHVLGRWPVNRALLENLTGGI